MTFEIAVDTSNNETLMHLNYYMLQNGCFDDAHANRRFLLDDRYYVYGHPKLFLYPIEPVECTFDGHPIRIVYSNTNALEKPRNYNRTEVVFHRVTVSSAHSLDHVSRFLLHIIALDIPVSDLSELETYIWVDHGWSVSRSFTGRKLDTIYFPGKQDIVDALDGFLCNDAQQALYRELDIPYKYVCLFHGLPGTGKTSMVRALASRFQYNLCLVKHAQDMDDTSLERMLQRLRKKSFLVFEDVDCLFDQREIRGKNNLSYSGILNMLDGVGKYDKLVVFFTTNRLHELDAAFKRRVDLFIEFGAARQVEVVEMYRRFFQMATEQDAKVFWSRIEHKTLTINMLEKHFTYCLRKGILPQQDLKYLEAYTQLTEEKVYTQLYS